MKGRIAIGDAEIAFERHGEGFPIVALHGFYPDRRLMMGALEPMFDAGDRIAIPASAACGLPGGGPSARRYQRVYPDLPFMGESGDPDSVGSSDDMLRVIADFINALLPDGPFLLAGESYGGYLARGLLRGFKQRVQGLLLLCPLIVAERELRTLPPHGAYSDRGGWAAGAQPADIAEFTDFAVVRDPYTFRRSMTEVIPGVRSARSSRLEALQSKGYAFTFDRFGSGGEAFDRPFDGPALFALGRQDSSTGWSDALRLAPFYPHASFAVLDGAGHNLQIEQSGALAALTAEWIGRCEASGS